MATMDDAVTLAYVGAGLVLPLFYLLQVGVCLRDRSGLDGFSLGKCAVQLVLRAAMLPFVLGVGNRVMSAIVLLDFVGRLLEVCAALAALRQQHWAWRDIVARLR